MSTQQLKAPAPLQRSSSLVWWLLGLAMVVLVAGLVIINLSQRIPAPAAANTTKVGSTQVTQPVALPFGPEIAASYGATGQGVNPFGPGVAASYGQAGQTVPDAATQGVNGYIQAHNTGSGQTVPDAATQGVNNYIKAHQIVSGQPVPDASRQGCNELCQSLP